MTTELRGLCQAQGAAVDRPQLRTARVVAITAALFWGWLFFGVQDSMTVFIEGQDFAAHYVLESGRALLAGSTAHLLTGAGVLLTAVAVGGFARLDLRPRRMRADLPLVACVLLAAVPAGGYARRMATSTADVEVTVGLDHYPIQAALAIAIVVIAGVIAIAKNLPGAPLAVAALVLTVVWIGVESVVYPHRLGSIGRVGGWIAAGWAMTFLVLALRPPRRAFRRRAHAPGAAADLI